MTFPLFSKIDVNGDNAHPLFKHLKEAAPGVFGGEPSTGGLACASAADAERSSVIRPATILRIESSHQVRGRA